MKHFKLLATDTYRHTTTASSTHQTTVDSELLAYCSEANSYSQCHMEYYHSPLVFWLNTHYWKRWGNFRRFWTSDLDLNVGLGHTAYRSVSLIDMPNFIWNAKAFCGEMDRRANTWTLIWDRLSGRLGGIDLKTVYRIPVTDRNPPENLLYISNIVYIIFICTYTLHK